MATLSRNKENFIIMTAIYNELTDFNFGENTITRSASEIISGLVDEPIENCSPFVVDSVNLALQNYGEAVKAFTPNLVNWTWGRIPLLSQAILLMSWTHYYKVEKIDRKIVINVAVDLAKEYIEEKQAKFINGILEKTLK